MGFVFQTTGNLIFWTIADGTRLSYRAIPTPAMKAGLIVNITHLSTNRHVDTWVTNRHAANKLHVRLWPTLRGWMVRCLLHTAVRPSIRMQSRDFVSGYFLLLNVVHHSLRSDVPMVKWTYETWKGSHVTVWEVKANCNLFRSFSCSNNGHN